MGFEPVNEPGPVFARLLSSLETNDSGVVSTD
jgi:hypothetical protein